VEARALRRPTTGAQAAEEAGPQGLGTPQQPGGGGEAAAGGVGGGMGGGDQLSRAPTQRQATASASAAATAEPTQRAEPLVCEVLEREHKPSAAGLRGAAVLHLLVPHGEPGVLELLISSQPEAAGGGGGGGGGGAAPRLSTSLQLMLSSGLTFYSENAVVTRALLHRRWIQVPAHHPFVSLYLPISPYISQYLPTSPYISLHLPGARAPPLRQPDVDGDGGRP